MAGLAAAARARELGAEPVVLEKGDRPGGSMLLSSGVIWRYRSFEDFRAECPGGDPALQRVIVEQLDEALEWLESLGAEVTERETGNPRTIGMRFDPRGLTSALVSVMRRRPCALCWGQSPELQGAGGACDRRVSRAARPRARVAPSGESLELRRRA